MGFVQDGWSKPAMNALLVCIALRDAYFMLATGYEYGALTA